MDSQFHLDLFGQSLTLESTDALFSPRHVDRGTLAMLSCAGFEPGMRVMDLGCGCGVVGILAARICGQENVVMSDVEPAAVEMARRNAAANGVGGVRVVVSDAFDAIDDTDFDLILSNPPYQSDFAVARRFIEKGFNRLRLGGRLLMVTKRREWYKNKLSAIFGGVLIHDIDGYHVFEAQRRSRDYAVRSRRQGRPSMAKT